MNTQTIALDVSKATAVPPAIHIRQGDKNGTILNVGIFDNGAALDLTDLPVRMCAKLPDGIHYYSVNGTASGNTASFEVDESYAAAYPGITDLAYVDVLDGDDVICSTQPFRIVVEPGAREGVVPSEEHISEIDAAVERANEAARECEDLAHPITNAQIDSIVADTAVTSDNKMTATNLTYFWGKLKTWAAGAFAAISHTHADASSSAAGFMSASEHDKLAGIEAGAEVNDITGVKGDSESTYRTGNVNLTAANVGAAASSHNHAASDISSGQLAIARGGTGASTAAGAKAAIVDGQALAPASVAATGAVSGSSISDSVGTLAALRESVSPTSWATMPIASGWDAYNSDQAPRYRKQGCIVQLAGAVKPTAETASDTWQTVGTLPSGFRPAYPTYAVCQGSSAYRLAVQINPNGNVMVGRYGTTASTSFVTSSWVRLDAVFMV